MIHSQLIYIKDTAPEHQGTKYKFWLGNELFKEGKVKGENWAEVMAYQLALLLDLPAAEYRTAQLTIEDELTYGTLSPNFVDSRNGERLINANELLGSWLGGKEYDQAKRYKHRAYTFSRSVALFKALEGQVGSTTNYTPIQQFIGYLLFDVLIANQDRHHENWGFISSSDGRLYLAPTYDHGSSLACRLTEEERLKRLQSGDMGYKIESFVKKANSAFYYNDKLLKTHKLAELCFQHYPSESKFWVDKIGSITEEQLSSVINFLGSGWLTEVEKEFTKQLLQINQKYLVELRNRDV